MRNALILYGALVTIIVGLLSGGFVLLAYRDLSAGLLCLAAGIALLVAIMLVVTI
jgi:hypothetical protein